MEIGHKSSALKELTYDGFALAYAKRTQFRDGVDGTFGRTGHAGGRHADKLGPSDQAARTVAERAGQIWKLRDACTFDEV
jgi:hypothetical protein